MQQHKYKLIRNQRKTIGIYIKQGAVEVRAPYLTPLSQIEAFVEKHREWIDKHMAQDQDKSPLDYGAFIPVLGNKYEIRATSKQMSFFEDSVCYVPQGLSEEEIKASCIVLYRELAKRLITQSVEYYSKQMSLYPSAVKINGARTRWGSCSSKKSLNFSWRLMMTDMGCLNYVVIHELAHLQEMNHGPKFWRIVAQTMPNYRDAERRLKTYAKQKITSLI